MASLALASALLSGCGWFGGKDSGTPGVLGSVRGFLGGAVADEPRAALAARDILSAGGNAADAAVAAAFTLTVSLPGQAPLGGGGMCLVVSGPAKARSIEMLSFPAVAARPDSKVATPGIPRGLFAIHGRFGVLRWEQVLSPAEILARNGGATTRALSYDLVRNWEIVRADPGLQAVFARDGKPASEGEPLSQPDLAVVLGALRQRGPGDLHYGLYARQLVRQLAAAGIDLRMEDLAVGVPQFGPSFRVGERVDLFVGATPANGALAAGQIYGALEGRWKSVSPPDRPAMIQSTAAAASRDRAGWIGADLANTRPLADAMSPEALRRLAGAGGAFAGEPDVPSGTGVSVVDRNGMAVACSLTGYRPFGIGRLPPGVGIQLVPAPDNASNSGRWLTAAIGMRDRRDVVFVGAASGGVSAPLALAQVALDTLIDGRELGLALGANRASPAGPMTLANDPTRVQAIVCPGGAIDEPVSCRIEADPRGAGLGIGSQ
ncbi:MAG: gamma-glutamyltransferase [Proteobacteria bacterium]|nr:gamma-glutamyltransferase [Pseudomonadota bacterium]